MQFVFTGLVYKLYDVTMCITTWNCIAAVKPHTIFKWTSLNRGVNVFWNSQHRALKNLQYIRKNVLKYFYSCAHFWKEEVNLLASKYWKTSDSLYTILCSRLPLNFNLKENCIESTRKSIFVGFCRHTTA